MVRLATGFEAAKVKTGCSGAGMTTPKAKVTGTCAQSAAQAEEVIPSGVHDGQ